MATRLEGAARHSPGLLAGQAIAALALMWVPGLGARNALTPPIGTSAGQCHRHAAAARTARSR